MNFNYRMRFSKTGRARFIAHLDTLSCLVRAVRRAGFDLAFTEGMRPKPVLSLAMPLGVGVEGENEICDFSLRRRAPLTELAKGLGGQLPEGLKLISVGPCYERSKAAARVSGVRYRIDVKIPEDILKPVLKQYNGSASFVLKRRRPKGDKDVDIKQFVETVELDEEGRGIIFEMKVTPEGTGRPEEVVAALAAICGRQIAILRTVRTDIYLQEEPPAPGKGRRSSGRAGYFRQ